MYLLLVMPKHPNKEINAAIEYAKSKDWKVETCNGHAWGQMFCPKNSPECRCGEHCITSIWSTPRNPEDHARKLRRIVDKCIFAAKAGGTDEEDEQNGI